MANVSVVPYVGDGGSNRSVTGAGFVPVLAWVIPWDGIVSGPNTYRPLVIGGGDTWFNQTFSWGPYVLIGVFDGIKTLDADGMTVGDNVAVNESGKNYVAVFFEGDSDTFFTVFNYFGDATDPQTIFLPFGGANFAAVFGYEGSAPRNFGPDVSGTVATQINGLDVSGDMNLLGVNYFGFQFKNKSGIFLSDFYFGSGADPQTVVQNDEFEPLVVLAEFDGNSYLATRDSVPDSAHIFATSGGLVTTAITATNGAGFEVGSRLNTSSQTYIFISLGDGAGGPVARSIRKLLQIDAAAARAVAGRTTAPIDSAGPAGKLRLGIIPTEAGGLATLQPTRIVPIEAGGMASVARRVQAAFEGLGQAAKSIRKTISLEWSKRIGVRRVLQIESMPEPKIRHTRTILTRLSEHLLHTRTIVATVASSSVRHTVTVLNQPIGIRHTRRVIPQQVVTLHSQDVQVPYGRADKS